MNKKTMYSYPIMFLCIIYTSPNQASETSQQGELFKGLAFFNDLPKCDDLTPDQIASIDVSDDCTKNEYFIPSKKNRPREKCLKNAKKTTVRVDPKKTLRCGKYKQNCDAKELRIKALKNELDILKRASTASVKHLLSRLGIPANDLEYRTKLVIADSIAQVEAGKPFHSIPTTEEDVCLPLKN